MATIWAFDHIEKKHTLYREKDCIEKFCFSLRDHKKNRIDFEKKMFPSTKGELKSQQDAKVCYICGKRILKQLSESLDYWKCRDHCHYTGKYTGVAHSICNLKFNVPNEIPVGFYKVSSHDYHFIVQKMSLSGNLNVLEKTQKSKEVFLFR